MAFVLHDEDAATSDQNYEVLLLFSHREQKGINIKIALCSPVR